MGLPSQQIQRLPLIQNSAARLVTRTKKHDSISSVLRNLYWLPIQSRIHFKVLLFAYQCFHQFGPSYLVELLTQYKPESPGGGGGATAIERWTPCSYMDFQNGP